MSHITEILDSIRQKGNFRSLPDISHDGKKIGKEGNEMLNLSSNDYLGLSMRSDWKEEFLDGLTPETFFPTSSSSRLLTGNFNTCTQLERRLSGLYGSESALVFNSGYHANVGILPAVSSEKTLILADKLVHASLIDGIRLSQGKAIRYRHNDYDQAERLIADLSGQYEQIIIVTESIFSMDGDEADLDRLVSIKKRYPEIWLYVDEAHAVGVRGEQGLGCAEENRCTGEIDFLVGTFGKALASVGAYVICREEIRQYLINTMRPFIFTTALPPVNYLWSLFVLNRLPGLSSERSHLALCSGRLRDAIRKTGRKMTSTSHIIPFLSGSSISAVNMAEQLQKKGYYALPVRPPTVPPDTARLRLSLTAALTESEISGLTEALRQL